MQVVKYDLLIDSVPFKKKPTTDEIKNINNRIVGKLASVTPQELAHLVGDEGRTMVLATMKGERKKANMLSQQVVALDFDNTVIVDGQKVKTTGNKYTSVSDIVRDPWIQENASFIYSTFSYKDNWQRFRVVFFLDRPMTKPGQTEFLYKWLMKKYPNADKSAKDCSRLFFGGTESFEINFDNVLKTDRVKLSEEEVKKLESPTDSIISRVIPLKNDEAITLMKDYINREKENLLEYENALSAIWCIAKAVKSKEISYPIAYELVDMLAMGNEEWRGGNKQKLIEALNTDLSEMHTAYTFRQKFSNWDDHSFSVDPTDMITTAKILVKELSIKIYNGKLYFKNGDHWISDELKLERKVTEYIELLRSKDKELIHQFSKYAEYVEIDVFHIQFRNNYYFENGVIHKGVCERFTPYYLEIDYNALAYNADVDQFLNFLSNDKKDVRLLIEEMFGHILMDHGFPHKAFFLTGNTGKNGKSTFVEMIKNCFGKCASAIALANFNDPTSVIKLEGKLVNLGDDIEAEYIERSSNFKNIVSGNTITVRPIYADPYEMKNKASLIFTANEMPLFKDKSGGIARRIINIPCDNVVDKIDYNINKKLSSDEAKSYIINLALQGFRRLLDQGGELSLIHI